ncbi:MAG TPA: histidine kinase, partial [Polyangiaceae bacterium]
MTTPLELPGAYPEAVVQQLQQIMTAAAADRGMVLKQEGSVFTPVAAVSIRPDGVHASEHTPCLPSVSILRRVMRSRRAVRLPRSTPRRTSVETSAAGRVHRALCLPVMHAGKVAAVLYVERSRVGGPFTEEQCQEVTLLAPQIATTMRLIAHHHREIKALHARVNPPFLHNAFSVIAQLATADPQEAEKAILMLSRLYRYVLSASPERVVTLAQEVAMSRDYLALEQHRLGERMQTEFEIDGPLERVHIPCLLLHTVVESSVSHGVATKLGGGRLKVAVIVNAKQCRLRVEDDGHAWADRGGQATSLHLVKQRLILHYRRRHSFRLEKSKGLAVEIC